MNNNENSRRNAVDDILWLIIFSSIHRTFKFYKRQQLYHAFMGASVAKLKSSIQQYSQPDAEPNPNAESEGSSMGCLIL